MNDEVKLILTKLKIVSEEKENGAYICDKEHSKLLLSYIEQLDLCYCNRTDCSSRIKDSKKYDSLLQKYEQLEKENRLQKERIAYLERSNNRREDTIISLQDELIDMETNRDKAIEILSGSYCTYDDVIKILKGDSDDKK